MRVCSSWIKVKLVLFLSLLKLILSVRRLLGRRWSYWIKLVFPSSRLISSKIIWNAETSRMLVQLSWLIRIFWEFLKLLCFVWFDNAVSSFDCICFQHLLSNFKLLISQPAVDSFRYCFQVWHVLEVLLNINWLFLATSYTFIESFVRGWKYIIKTWIVLLSSILRVFWIFIKSFHLLLLLLKQNRKSDLLFFLLFPLNNFLSWLFNSFLWIISVLISFQKIFVGILLSLPSFLKSICFRTHLKWIILTLFLCRWLIKHWIEVFSLGSDFIFWWNFLFSNIFLHCFHSSWLRLSYCALLMKLSFSRTCIYPGW